MRGAGPARSITRGPGSPFPPRDERLEDLPALQQLERAVELRIGPELAFLHLHLDVARHLTRPGRLRVAGPPAAPLALPVAPPGPIEVMGRVGLAAGRRVTGVGALRGERALVRD